MEGWTQNWTSCLGLFDLIIVWDSPSGKHQSMFYACVFACIALLLIVLSPAKILHALHDLYHRLLMNIYRFFSN